MSGQDSQRGRMVRQTALLSVGTYIEYFLGMVASVILARHLGPTEFGIYGLAIWIAVFARTLINSGVTLGVTRFVAAAGGTEDWPMARRINRYFLGVHGIKVVACVALIALVLPWVAPSAFPNVPMLALWLVLGAIVLRTTYMYLIAAAKGLQDYKSVAVITTVGAIINLGLIYAGVQLGLGVAGFVAIFVLSGAVFCLAAVARMRGLLFGKAAPEIEPDTQAKISRHLRIVTATLVIGYFASKELEIVLLGALGAAEDVGYFKVAITLSAGLVLLIPGIFSGVLLPMMARSVALGKETAGRRLVISTRYLILLSIPLLAFCAAYGKEIIGTIYGDQYLAAGVAFSICVLASTATTLADGAQSYLLSSERQPVILKLVIAAVIVKLVAGPLAIMQFGLLGAAWTFALVNLGVAAIKFRISMSDLDVAFPLSELFRVLVAAGIALLIARVAAFVTVPLVALALAAVVFAPVYALTTFLLGCWSREDIVFFRQLAGRLPRLLARPLNALFAFSERHRLAQL